MSKKGHKKGMKRETFFNPVRVQVKGIELPGGFRNFLELEFRPDFAHVGGIEAKSKEKQDRKKARTRKKETARFALARTRACILSALKSQATGKQFETK